MYILVKDNENIYPYTKNQLRLDNPNVSFPAEISEQTLTEFGVYPVVISPTPAYNIHSQRAIVRPPEQVDGTWTQDWDIAQLSDDEIQSILQGNADNVRAQRDALLAETDWVIVKSVESGEPIPTNIRDYRQALRDITSQTGFPLEVNWPSI